MEPWTVKLLPNIVVDIPTARKKAKALGYKFVTKIQSFQDLAREERRVWWLEAIKSAAVIKPYASYINESFVYKHRAAFNLIEELQGLPPLIEAPDPKSEAPSQDSKAPNPESEAPSQDSKAPNPESEAPSQDSKAPSQ